MSIVNAKEIMIEAAKGKYAIGAFNITDLVQLEGVVDAAVELKSPVIIQTSVKPSKFLGTDVLVAIYPDHGGRRRQCRSACTWTTAPRWLTARNALTQATPTS